MGNEEREALSAEFQTLRRVRERSPEEEARLKAVRGRLVELLAVPPAGYEAPEAGRRLVEHARAHGWLALEQWGQASDGAPFYTVQVGRAAEDEEGRRIGLGWEFRRTWHSRGAAPGRVRLFGSGTAQTPEVPRTHDAPSVQRIRELITAYPVS
ncbi:hypothetical protein ABT093_19605 [Kitasatospora sp. NPDC002551]|uniref:hypothetical protein n=1 Tax=Kitasatospora sp. NPDC002551 TaxID=3154539 RepID=UPI00332A043C